MRGLCNDNIILMGLWGTLYLDFKAIRQLIQAMPKLESGLMRTIHDICFQASVSIYSTGSLTLKKKIERNAAHIATFEAFETRGQPDAQSGHVISVLVSPAQYNALCTICAQHPQQCIRKTM